VAHESATREGTAKADGMAKDSASRERTAKSTKEIHERSEIKRTRWPVCHHCKILLSKQNKQSDRCLTGSDFYKFDNEHLIFYLTIIFSEKSINNGKRKQSNTTG